MSDLEVLVLVLDQIGGLRIPLRETELRDHLGVIVQNLTALKEAMEDARKATDTKEAGQDV